MHIFLSVLYVRVQAWRTFNNLIKASKIFQVSTLMSISDISRIYLFFHSLACSYFLLLLFRCINLMSIWNDCFILRILSLHISTISLMFHLRLSFLLYIFFSDIIQLILLRECHILNFLYEYLVIRHCSKCKYSVRPRILKNCKEIKIFCLCFSICYIFM